MKERKTRGQRSNAEEGERGCLGFCLFTATKMDSDSFAQWEESDVREVTFTGR